MSTKLKQLIETIVDRKLNESDNSNFDMSIMIPIIDADSGDWPMISDEIEKIATPADISKMQGFIDRLDNLSDEYIENEDKWDGLLRRWTSFLFNVLIRGFTAKKLKFSKEQIIDAIGAEDNELYIRFYSVTPEQKAILASIGFDED
jgi:hypothetical protein